MNGDDPVYIKKCQKFAENIKDVNPERFRDVYDMLKFSLRSIEQFVPWAGNIYILTQKPQVPEWLDIDHPRIKIVHHEDIFDKEYLPTYSSSVIESYLDKIPGLSEHFLYMNDDFLFGKETPLEAFVSKEGKINIFGTLLGENPSWRIYEAKNDIVGLGLVEHCPILVKKEFWDSMYNLWPEKTHEKRLHRFRQDDDFMAYKLYKYYMLKFQRHICRPVNVFELKKWQIFHKITNNLKKQQKALARITRKKPNFYCFNDDQKNNPDPDVVKLVQGFLKDYYSIKSSFEK
ncbi:MAG: hypothetical protein ABJH98_09060 [Reichenbachiella sp.]